MVRLRGIIHYEANDRGLVMKLFYSPFHTFIHKVLVSIHEAELWERTEFVATYPFKNRSGEDQGEAYSIAAINPLNKVPTLALDDGQVVYGSQAIVECVDSIGSGPCLYPVAGTERWEALTRLALADTMFETTVMLVMEGWLPAEQQRLATYKWIWPKIISGLDRFEWYCEQGFERFDIGHAAMLHALSYMDFRAQFYGASDPVHPDFDCFDQRPHLRAWWQEACSRPSVVAHYNVDFSGDDSATHCQHHVREVLTLQGEHGTR